MKESTYRILTGRNPFDRNIIIYYIGSVDDKYQFEKEAIKINGSDDDILKIENKSDFITWFSREFLESKTKLNKSIPENVKEIGLWVLMNSYVDVPDSVVKRIESGRTKIKHYLKDYS